MTYLNNNIEIILYAISFILGATVGSFLNVVAYRLPKILFDHEYQMISEFLIEESTKPHRFLSGIKIIDRLLTRPDAVNLLEKDNVLPVKGLLYLSVPGSACPRCNHKIKFYENIPILGWCFLRGKCSECQQIISVQYPLIEFLTGLLTFLVVYIFGFNIEALCYAFFIWILISLTLIDFKFQILPDVLTSPMIWLGLILSFFEIISIPFENAFYGVIAGYLSLWTVNQFSLVIFKKVGIGAGDFKLLALIGAWQGIGSILNVILISSITGAVVGIILLFYSKRKNQSKYIPYGPFLALGSLAVLFLGLTPETFFY